mgnify:CR=1 FL=1
MKRKILSLSAMVLITFMATSCDTKSCKCYYYDGTNPAYMETEYVSEGTACSTLDYQRGNQYRTCLEMSEADIDPGSIGREYK